MHDCDPAPGQQLSQQLLEANARLRHLGSGSPGAARHRVYLTELGEQGRETALRHGGRDGGDVGAGAIRLAENPATGAEARPGR